MCVLCVRLDTGQISISTTTTIAKVFQRKIGSKAYLANNQGETNWNTTKRRGLLLLLWREREGKRERREKNKAAHWQCRILKSVIKTNKFVRPTFGPLEIKVITPLGFIWVTPRTCDLTNQQFFQINTKLNCPLQGGVEAQRKEKRDLPPPSQGRWWWWSGGWHACGL